MSNIIQPNSAGRMEVQQHLADSKGVRFTSTPIDIPLPNGRDIALHSFGGMTPLEEAAIRIAAGMGGNTQMDAADVAREAVNTAEAVLAECQRRREAQIKAAG